MRFYAVPNRIRQTAPGGDDAVVGHEPSAAESRLEGADMGRLRGLHHRPPAGRMRLPRSLLRLGAVRAMAGRLSWGLADQAVSSITNLMVGLVVARSLERRPSSACFSLAWVTYGVIINLSRGLATDALARALQRRSDRGGGRPWRGRRAPRC